MRNLWMALLWAVLLTGSGGARAAQPPSNASRALRGVLSTGGHTVALDAEGTVWSWGYNVDGRLGDGTQRSRSTPAPVPGLTDVVGLTSTAYGASLVLRQDGTVWGFGSNATGVLADTPRELYSTPAQLPALVGVKALSAGEQTGLALLEDGTVRAWGSNSHDQIGDGVSSIHRTAVQARLPCRFTAMTSRDHRASEAKHCPAMP